MSPQELRRRLLAAIAEHEKTGSSHYAEDRVLADKLAVDLSEVHRQLEILEDDKMVRLSKAMGPTYGALLKPAGWKTLESEQAGPPQGKIFISCGQFTEEERKLGTQVAKLVAELTPFTPYFAEDQSDLQGLTEHIFRALHQSEGLIAIMHHRGTVTRPSGDIVRASVWIEQEIAIAAFMRQVLDRQIPVQAYIQKGIGLEGVREKVILNPKSFTTGEEVLQDLRRVLPVWSPAPQTPKLEIKLDAKKTNRYAETTEFTLSAIVLNNSDELISSSLGVDIRFPARFVGRATTHPDEVRDRATDSHRMFHRVVNDERLFPQGHFTIFSLLYVIVDLSYAGDPELDLPVTARLFQDGKAVGTVTKPLREITPLFG